MKEKIRAMAQDQAIAALEAELKAREEKANAETTGKPADSTNVFKKAAPASIRKLRFEVEARQWASKIVNPWYALLERSTRRRLEKKKLKAKNHTPDVLKYAKKLRHRK